MISPYLKKARRGEGERGQLSLQFYCGHCDSAPGKYGVIMRGKTAGELAMFPHSSRWNKARDQLAERD